RPARDASRPAPPATEVWWHWRPCRYGAYLHSTQLVRFGGHPFQTSSSSQFDADLTKPLPHSARLFPQFHCWRIRVKTIRLLLLGMLCCLISAPALTHAQAATQANPADVYNRLLGMMEKQIVGAADAMPADKFNFAPTQGDFKGVRTFGEQVKHLA